MRTARDAAARRAIVPAVGCDKVNTALGRFDERRLLLAPCQTDGVWLGSWGYQAGVAQLVEHLICNQAVGGSNPFASSRSPEQPAADEALDVVDEVDVGICQYLLSQRSPLIVPAKGLASLLRVCG